MATKSLADITKLSDLLALGLADLEKQEKAPDSVVNMDVWLYRNGKCEACLAGSVMRFTLEVMPEHDDELTPSRTDYYSQLTALNRLRVGDIWGAARVMNRRTPFSDREIPDYHQDSEGWWSAMRKLHADLVAAGE